MSKRNKVYLGLFITVFLVLITATYAWFTVGLNANIMPISLLAESNDNLEIRAGRITDPNATGFGKEATFDEIPINYSRKEISSNGINFYAQGGSRMLSGKPKAFKPGVAGVDFVSQDFTFRAISNISVYLGSTSTITSPAKPLLANAVRVGFYEWDGADYNLIYVWAPNTSQPANAATCVINMYGDEGTYSVVKDGLPSPALYQPESDIGKLVDLKVDDSGYALKTIQVRIWLEGTDPDANDSNLIDKKGTFITSLFFMGFTTS